MAITKLSQIGQGGRVVSWSGRPAAQCASGAVMTSIEHADFELKSKHGGV